MAVTYRSQQERDQDREARAQAREERIATYGTNTPNVNDRRRLEAMQRGAAIEKEIKESGGSIPLDGMSLTGQPISTLGMTNSDRMTAQNRMVDYQQKEAKRQAPLKQFERDINRSVAFGAESNLLTPEGRTRAMKQAVKAGMSYQDADAAVQGAFDFLNKRYGKKDTTLPEQYGPPKALANAAATGAATTSTPTTTPTTPEQQTAGQFIAESLAEDIGLGEGGRNPILQSAQGGKLVSDLMRAYSAKTTKELGELLKKSGGKGLAELGADSKKLLEEYERAKKAANNMQQMGKGASVGSPLAKGMQTTADAATAAASKADEALAATQAGANVKGAQRAADTADKIAKGKVVKGLGRLGAIATVAEPVLEYFDYQQNPELLDAKMEQILERNEQGLLPTVGAAARDVTPVPAQVFNPNYSPVGTLAATIGAPLEAFNRLKLAEGELAAQQMLAERAKEKADAVSRERKKIVSDEDYMAMSVKERREVSKQAAEALKASEAVRKLQILERRRQSK